VGIKERGRLVIFFLLSIVVVFFLVSNTSTEMMLNWGQMTLLKNGSKLVKMEECGCSRLVNFQENVVTHKHSQNVTLVEISLENTTCSVDAFSRGAHQNIVSFTFFESSEEVPKNDQIRGYFTGVRENLSLIKQIYPGYVMRLYYQASPEVKEKLCQIACSDPGLDLCPATAIPKLGNATKVYPLLWRFLPAIDPQVNIFLSRDLDSRVNEREAAAFNEFLESNAKIHIMRDHPAHEAVMLGGTWAAKVTDTRNRFRKSFSELFKNGLAYIDRFKGGWDQVALHRYVWPWARKMALIHDSYTCKKFSYTHPFPTKRTKGVGNYVGSVLSLNASIDAECPEKCRPKEHKDWLYC